MSVENKGNAGDAGNVGSGAIDLTKYVAKEDFDKASGSIKELEQKLDEAKLSLLDPEYVQFLESKKGKSLEKRVSKSLENIDVSKLSSQQIIELAVEKAKEDLLPEIQGQLSRTNQTLADVLAVLELQDVEKRYPDFNDYRDKTKKEIETSQAPLTIEQAYLLAKSKAGGNIAPATPKGSERPGGNVPSDTLVTKVFKGKSDAAEDAWDQVVGSGKDTL